MPQSSSWMPYAPQGVKGFDDVGDDISTSECNKMSSAYQESPFTIKL
jgi:hypothetical protein